MRIGWSLHTGRPWRRLLAGGLALAFACCALLPAAAAPPGSYIPVPSRGGYGSWYYQIGGAQGISRPANRKVTRVTLGGSARLGLGYSCGAFDPVLGVSNILDGIAAGAERMVDAMVLAAKAAIGALPAYILQRANPGLYDLFMNALLKAEETINLTTKNCEAMEAEIAQGKDPFREWVMLSKGQDWRLAMGTGGDIVAAKQTVEDNNGSNGVPWLGGMRGGADQAPIEVVADTVRAGYNLTVNQGAAAKSASAPADSRLAAVWPSSKDAVEWARDVLGDVIVRTCADCPPAGIPGTGLLPGAEQTREAIEEKLTGLVEATQAPTQENLEQVSAPGMGVGVNVELIRAIQDLTPDERALITAKLAGESAQAQVLEKTLLLRRLVLAGRQVPEIAASGPGRAEIDRKLAELDQEIENLLFETKVRRAVMSDTAVKLLAEVRARRGASLGIPRPPLRDPSPLQGGAVVPAK